jgi:hypothetical protein
MKTMRISLKERDIIQIILDSKQVGARRRTMSMWEVLSAAGTAERDLAILGVPVHHRVGSRYVHTKHRCVLDDPSSHARRAVATTVVLERGTRGWYLIEVRRAPARVAGLMDPDGVLDLRPAARDAVLHTVTRSRDLLAWRRLAPR